MKEESMIKFLTPAVVCFFISGCVGLSSGDFNQTQPECSDKISNNKNQYPIYKPIEPLYLESARIFDKKTKKMCNKFWDEMDRKEKLDQLPNQSAEVSLFKTDGQANMKYLTGSIGYQKGKYIVIMDYMKYRVEPVLSRAKENEGEFLGNTKMGIGLRIKADVDTTENNVNLGGLLAIGAEAKNGNLKGNISIEVIGIDSPDVTNLIPLTSEIDQTSIQSALQALASIKAKIHDNNTNLTPHIVAISEVKEGLASQILEQTTKQYSPDWRKIAVEIGNAAAIYGGKNHQENEYQCKEPMK